MSGMVKSITSRQISLLEKLSNACAISGDEAEVRKIVLDEVRPHADDLRVDALGNVLITRKSTLNDPLRVMLAAHMDEIGFMLTTKEENGLFGFELVGGIDVRQLAGKPVWVGQKHTPGVIGTKPIHLTTREEQRQIIPLDSLRIDLGGDAGDKVKLGDRATFATAFKRVGNSLLGKALDDRIGVATLIEMVKNPPGDIELLAAFTVQEEVGLRGAKVAGYTFNPDLAIVLDCTPANDLPMWDDSENYRYNTRLGAGAAVYVADGSTVSDPRLVRFLLQTAEAAGIPFQVRQPGGGGTDAGAIHRQRGGIPSVSLSVPARYTHTAVSLCRLDDWKNTLALLNAALQKIDRSVLERK